ncbi:MAG: site-specific integrase [Thermodesulfobacteriota bacterium]|jgi:integrase
MGFWKDKDTKLWKYKFEMGGQTYGGGGFKSKREARAAREERRAKVKREIESSLRNPSGPLTYLEAVNSYLAFSERRHATDTFTYKQRVYRLFGDFLQGNLKTDPPLEAITSSMVSEYLSTLTTSPVYNAHRKELGALFSYSVRVLGIPMPKNPCQVIEKLPQGIRQKKTWTMEEFKRLLASLTPQEKPMILTLAYTMARIDEVLRLKVSDVNLTEDYLTLYTRKNKDGSYRSRNIPIGAQLKKTLIPFCHGRQGDEFVFINPNSGTRYFHRPHMMLAICKRSGITHYGFHAIRHFITSYLYDKKDVGKTDLQRLLGHQTPTTTDIYINGLDDNLRAPVEKLGGLLNEKQAATSGDWKIVKPNSAMFSVN